MEIVFSGKRKVCLYHLIRSFVRVVSIYGVCLRSPYLSVILRIGSNTLVAKLSGYLGGHLEKLTAIQSTYIDVHPDGPFKPDYYRY